jgi:alanyl-tRNA synthetase
LNWALREVMGVHVRRKVVVDQDKTRFDFSQPRPLTRMSCGGGAVGQREHLPRGCGVRQYVPQQQALQIRGLRGFSARKYQDEVRVLSVGTPVDDLLGNTENPRWREVSIEFCGCTHVQEYAESSTSCWSAKRAWPRAFAASLA